jgi:hypothetical protein
MQGKIRMKSSRRRSLVQQEDKQNMGSNDGGAAMLIMVYDAGAGNAEKFLLMPMLSLKAEGAEEQQQDEHDMECWW